MADDYITKHQALEIALIVVTIGNWVIDGFEFLTEILRHG